MLSLSLALVLSIALGNAGKIESKEDTNWSRCKRYGAFPNTSVAPVPCLRQ